EGEGRKDAATARMSGRAPDNRLVHFSAREFAGAALAEAARVGAAPLDEGIAEDGTNREPARPLIRPGDFVTTTITYGAPHHLVADGPVLGIRRTRAGDL